MIKLELVYKEFSKEDKKNLNINDIISLKDITDKINEQLIGAIKNTIGLEVVISVREYTEAFKLSKDCEETIVLCPLNTIIDKNHGS